ncbi:MAG TPA: hypothetical protein PLY37_00580 [Candidatus Pacearchaeota archaeon]|nr:hypothetical protein [Candidatus Pacearchaeota archaeon]
MNSKRLFSFLALTICSFLFLGITLANASNVCNKNKICDLKIGENKSNCPSDCKNIVHPQLKFIQADITAYNGDIAKMNDFAEATIKFSVKAVNGDIYIPNNPGLFCNATGTKNVSVLLAETIYDPKNKIYVVPKNLTKEFECKIFLMPEQEGKYYAYMPNFVWGKSGKTASQNVWNYKKYSFLNEYSTYGMNLRKGDMPIVSMFHILNFKDRIASLEKALEKEKNVDSKKKTNKLKLEINYLNEMINELGPNSKK